MRRQCVDDDASPEVLELWKLLLINIHVDDTITPGVGLSSNTMRVRILAVILVPQLMNCITATGGDKEAKDEA